MVAEVVGVLAGSDLPANQLCDFVKHFDFVVAADGGANRLVRGGVTPNVVVGDMDSLDPELVGGLPDVRIVRDQDSSDCEKLLALVHEMGFSGVTLVGLEGDRIDHCMASLQAAARSPLNVKFKFRCGRGNLLRGPCQFETDHNGTLSLLPISVCSGVSIRGVQWPLEDVVLDPLGITSLSNWCKQTLRVQMAAGAALLVLSESTEGSV